MNILVYIQVHLFHLKHNLKSLMTTFSNQNLPRVIINSLEENAIHNTFFSQFDHNPLQFHQTPNIIDSSFSSPNVVVNQQLQLTAMSRNREKITHCPKFYGKEEDKGRNQSRPSNAAMLKNGEKKNMNNNKGKRKINETQYIHVRARRGQATDSHSLAERARREKINERMRLLQSIVPGCDKVIGKTQILDEIINYIQSLQYQVELLFGKLSSITPMINDFESDFNTTTLLFEDKDIYSWEINDQRLKLMNQSAQLSILSPF